MKTIYTSAALLLFTFSFGQQLLITSSDGKYGVINDNGVEIIPAKYTSIDEFGKDHADWTKVCLNNV